MDDRLFENDDSSTLPTPLIMLDSHIFVMGFESQGHGLSFKGLGIIQLCQEYFEYTPGVLRAYVKPKHLDALTFTLQPVIEAVAP